MARDYARLLHQLLPPGPIWDKLGPNMQGIVDALAVEFARGDARGVDLEAEMMPSTAVELIGEWETALGLPDDGCTLPTLLADRQAAAQARFTARGQDYGTGVVFLTAVAARVGYTGITIRRFYRTPYACTSLCEDELNPGWWKFVWEIIAPHGTLDDQLVCEMRKSALFHIELVHSYPLFLLSSLTYVRVAGMTFTHPETGTQSTLGANEPGTVYLGV